MVSDSDFVSLRRDVEYLKKHMLDSDSVLSEDDFVALQSYREEKRSGSLTSHAVLKKDLGL